MNEDELIRRLKVRAAGVGGERIGDDAAVLPAGGPWAVTVDSQIEGVHFVPGLDPSVIARRLLAVNLSDLAAMGAEPAYGFLALQAPKTFDHLRFFDAFLDACAVHGMELSGGDLSGRDTVTAVLTLIGRHGPSGRFVERAGARPGHELWLGGPVGESALGMALVGQGASLVDDRVDLGPLDPGPLGALDPETAALAERAVRRHLLPEPQLALGRRLAELEEGGAIDVSDGLAKDLHRLCEASGVGAELELDLLEAPAGWSGLEDRVEASWEDLALAGGEDYVLCFSVPRGSKVDDWAPEARRIGRIMDGSGVTARSGGRSRALPPVGWDHLSS